MRSLWAGAVAVSLLMAPASMLAAQPVDDSRASAGKPKSISLEGYAEWRQGDTLIVDGQRVRAAARHRFKGKGDATAFNTVPLGYEVKVKGVRQRDGSVLADRVEAQPNGEALFEGDLRESFDTMETLFRSRGRMVEIDGNGQVQQDYGRLIESGPRVERVRRMTRRLVPPYLRPEEFRTYVVENEEWNAMCAPNRSIYVFSGLLDDMDDDEVAIVVGHELAHSTHEHSRRAYKKTVVITLAALGIAATAEATTENRTKKRAVQALAVVGALAWKNGYGRGNEDQADRVGLRYSAQAGYDVRKGPGLWQRFATKYGDPNKVVNFFLGDHSVAKDRARNLERELALNYTH